MMKCDGINRSCCACTRFPSATWAPGVTRAGCRCATRTAWPPASSSAPTSGPFWRATKSAASTSAPGATSVCPAARSYRAWAAPPPATGRAHTARRPSAPRPASPKSSRPKSPVRFLPSSMSCIDSSMAYIPSMLLIIIMD